ncbi:MAG: tRNA-dihydrouridine synthase, partial [Microcystis panniformis]
PKPTPSTWLRASSIDLLSLAKEHLQGLWLYKGQRGIWQARKHLAWYCQDFTGAAVWRDRFSRIESLEEGCDLIDGVIAQLNLENENIYR